MARRLPPLNALRAFDAAAAASNFTEAARQLNVSQGAVSRHVAQLEAFLGTVLFERNHNQVTLTAEGAHYAAAIRGALDRIEEATALRLAARRRRPLRIRLFPTFALRWLISRLAKFHTLHPAIDVEITTTTSLVSFEHDAVDFTIQIPNTPREGVRYERLIAIGLVPVCSPAYLGTIAPPATPADLLGCTLLHSMKRPDDWRTWCEAAAIAPGALHEGLSFGNSSLSYQAAIDGAGIAMAHTALVREDLASGRLAVVFPLIAATGEAYHLASRTAQAADADIAAFRAWILEEARAEGGMPGG